ncbi:MAG: hypothetical protein IJ193_03565 [Bacilli bacterium]|nr:hypothetical protein [Bacilli bacterium]
MSNFFTWDVLTTYTSFVTIVYMVVEFTKELKYINKVPTKYWSFFVAFILLTITNVAMGSFKFLDIVLYVLTSISISLGSNGLSDFSNKNKLEDKNEK